MLICPKCKAEYQDGYVKCSDCNVNLVSYTKPVQAKKEINKKGVRVIKYGVGLLFSTLLELIITIIIYEFYWVYKLDTGGVYGTVIQNVHPLIWLIIIVQIIISVIVMRWGSNFKDSTSEK